VYKYYAYCVAGHPRWRGPDHETSEAAEDDRSRHNDDQGHLGAGAFVRGYDDSTSPGWCMSDSGERVAFGEYGKSEGELCQSTELGWIKRRH